MANVKLSEQEMEIVLNSEFILTKNRIIEQVKAMFAQLAAEYATLMGPYPQLSELQTNQAKISRGEQFLGLPYLILDYPRIFGKEDILAVRSFFWWGHFFSISLLLTGHWKEKYQQSILGDKNLSAWEIDLSDSPWHHENIQTLPLSDVKWEKVQSHSFLKITTHLPLLHWAGAPDFFVQKFDEIIRMLAKA